MPTITTVDAAWTPGPIEFTDAEARRFDTAMFLGDGSNNGVRGGIVRHGDSSLAVSVNGSDQITVQAGAFVIPAATGLGVYRGALSAATAASEALTRNGTNPRIDLVVIEATSTGAVVKTIEGTPGASPSAPALPAQHIELARLTVPAVSGGAVTVDSTYRAYATGLGGTLYVETADRLPGSGNQKGQRAVALDTGVEYRWSGTAWVPTSGILTVVPGSGVDATNVRGFRLGTQAVLYTISLTATTALGATFRLFYLPAGTFPSLTVFGDLVSTTSNASVRIRATTAGDVVTEIAVASGDILRGQFIVPTY